MRQLTDAETKQIELEITDEIHRICTEHNLQYFLAYGSLIGAMRHQGFIPWDDDMDLWMFRKDYTELVRHFDEWKSDDRFILIAPELDNSPYHFAKVYDSRTLMKQTYTRDEYTTGIWVDIFTLDWFDSKNRASLRKIRRLLTVRYLAVANLKAPSASPLVTLAKRIGGTILSRVNPRSVAKRIDELAKQQCTIPGENVAVIFYVDKMTNEVFHAEWFEPMLVPFEGRTYYAPKGYDSILTMRYGDWKVPVPEERHSSDVFML